MALLAVILGPLNPRSNRTNKAVQEETTVISAPIENQASGFAVVAGQTSAVWDDTHGLPDGALDFSPTGSRVSSVTPQRGESVAVRDSAGSIILSVEYGDRHAVLVGNTPKRWHAANFK